MKIGGRPCRAVFGILLGFDKISIEFGVDFVHLVISGHPRFIFSTRLIFFHVDSMTPDGFFGHETSGKYFLYCLEVFKNVIENF